MWYSHRVTKRRKLCIQGEESLHFPAFSIAAELATILSSAFAPPSIGRDQFDSVFFRELRVEWVRVVGFVTNQPGRKFVEKTSGKNLFNKLALGRRSALDRYAERKTVISGDSHALRPLAAPGGSDGKAPFLALAKVASTNASSRFSRRPRLSSRCRGHSGGSTTAHCSSVSSQRPVIDAFGDHRAVPGLHEFRRSAIYETGSSLLSHK